MDKCPICLLRRPGSISHDGKSRDPQICQSCYMLVAVLTDKDMLVRFINYMTKKLS